MLTLLIVVICIVLGFLALFLAGLCKVAGDADDHSEALFAKMMAERQLATPFVN